LIFGSRGGEGGNQAGFIYHSPLPGQFTRSILAEFSKKMKKPATERTNEAYSLRSFVLA
jgi:hypothetical protein